MLVREGEVKTRSSNKSSGEETPMHIFLFSDVIMFARSTSKLQRKLMAAKSLRMADEMRLADCTVSKTSTPGLVHAFDICSVVTDVERRAGSALQRGRSAKRLRPRKITVLCESASEMDEWLRDIAATIDEARSSEAADAAVASIVAAASSDAAADDAAE